MNSLEERSWAHTIVYVFFCCMSAGIAALSATNLISSWSGWASMLYIVAAVFIAVIIFVAFHRSGSRSAMFALGLFLAAFLAKSWIVLSVNTQPASDFYLLYTAAENLARGVNILGDYDYFSVWAYQSGFVVWMAILIKLFGAGIAFLKLTNCVFSALTSLLIYLTARRFASERAARVSAVIYTLYPGTFLLIPVLTNQHLSEFLMMSALYVYTTPTDSSRNKIALGIAAGVILALCNAIRPIGGVVALAVLVNCAMQIISRLKTKGAGIGLQSLRAAVLLSVYLLTGTGISGLVKITGINEYGLANNLPEWKFIVGLNVESGGSYNMNDELAVFGEGVDRDAAVEALMRERLSISFSDFCGLVITKTQNMWGAYEPVGWAFLSDVREELELKYGPEAVSNALQALEWFGSGAYILANLLTALGVIFLLRKKAAHEALILLLLVALAYFGAHIFIEVQSRYRSLMTTVTFPVIALGADAVYPVCSRIIRRLKAAFL